MRSFLPGEIVRLTHDPAVTFVTFGGEPRERFEFVRFLGEFDGDAVVENAQGVKRLTPFMRLAHIDNWTENPF